MSGQAQIALCIAAAVATVAVRAQVRTAEPAPTYPATIAIPIPPAPGAPAGSSGGQVLHLSPPPEAIAACNAKARNAPCTFTSPKGVRFQGVCHAMPQGSLSCAPKSATPASGSGAGSPPVGLQ